MCGRLVSVVIATTAKTESADYTDYADYKRQQRILRFEKRKQEEAILTEVRLFLYRDF
jgi:hypothetical protein